MHYLFVDLENITPKSLSGLPSDHMVYVFVGDKQGKMSMDLAESMLERGPNVKLIRINGTGKDALDFHIAYHLGRLCEKDKSASYDILSKDKGFDTLVKYLQEEGLRCSRIEKVPSKISEGSELKSMLNNFIAHITGLPEKTRPKKVAKLKAYLKHWAHQDESLVDPILDGMVSEKRIEIEGEKIKYL